MEELFEEPIEIGIPFTNNEFYLWDQNVCYGLTQIALEWLYSHDPKWTCCSWYVPIVDKGGIGMDYRGRLFRFSKPSIAVLFKLRWA